MIYKRRKRGLFDPESNQPFRLSRSKVDLFLQCPRCFYLDRRLGLGRPSMPGFSLNNAVDELLKKEFDAHRMQQTPHPVMQQAGLNAVPLQHEKMDDWRDSLRKGIEFVHPETNLLLCGGVDDIWE